MPGIRDKPVTSLRALAHPALMFLALPWLMVLLILGTVSQRYIGLYASQKIFFGSFVLWAGYVPLPGAYSVLMLISVSLVAKLALKSPFTVRKTGTIIVHVSALVLLLGGLITALAREEGYLLLADGEKAQAVSDYRERSLTIMRGGAPLASWTFAQMRPGETLSGTGLPFAIHILRLCYPCAVEARAHPDAALRGTAAKLGLKPVPYSKEDAQNQAGVEFGLSGAGADGTYIAFEGLAGPDTIFLSGGKYEFALKPAERALPFAVRLVHFEKTDYPGTDMARAYRSDVVIEDGAVRLPATIEMNQPLRYKGYTFYQSSFVEDEGRVMTVLAVVKNAGEWFPYIAITLLCLGLIVHLRIMLRSARSASSLASPPARG